MCVKHYKRWKKYGDPLFVRPRGYRGTPEERFWAKVNKNASVPEYRPDLGPCHIWTGAQNNGYGVFWDGSHLVSATRFAYELEDGPIPPGYEPDHLCRNPPCVNRAHLESVTHQENVLRGISPAADHSRKETCSEGHEYDKVVSRGNGRTGRRCSICDNQKRQERSPRLSGPVVACECGCGATFRESLNGRPRRWLNGHQRKRAALPWMGERDRLTCPHERRPGQALPARELQRRRRSQPPDRKRGARRSRRCLHG